MGEKKREEKDSLASLDLVNELEKEISKVMVGQKEVVRGVLRAIICDGHVLLEGVPGIAKTLLIKALAHTMGCNMKRVQFTVDLLPTDILGITKFNEKINDFEIIKGPIFSNFLIADEINRSPAKTQSALLEAMQEKKVSIGKKTYDLERPFIVLATENPIEQSGVYSLPEAQLDRFLFKLIMSYPSALEEKEILEKNITIYDFEDFELKKILNPEKILALQKEAKSVFCSEEMKDYIVRLVQKTRSHDLGYSKYVSFGASPRASISIFIAAKAEALINGRNYVIPTDVKAVIYPILRHRILVNYEAEADNINTDMIIEQVLKTVEVK